MSAALLLLATIVPLPANAQPIDTAAEQVLMIDHETGTVLLSKEPDASVVPASMAKLMTLEVAFTAIKEGRLSLDDRIFISEHAWRTGGAPSGTATMFAEVNSEVPLADLLRGITVQTANDACIAIAEALAGSEQAFAEIMNERAAELGLTDTHFTNPTGLPEPEGQQTTVSDLMTLARHLIDAHGDFYSLFGEPEFEWNGINQRNRNPLMREMEGIDGLMPGYSEASGYGITASAVIGGQRIILAMHGLSSSSARVSEAQRLFSWAARSFERVEVFGADEVVGEVGVFGGEQGRLPVSNPDGVTVLLPRNESTNLRGRIVYTSPLRAPIGTGDAVATLRLQNDGMVVSETPLYAAESVGAGPLHRRAFDAAIELVIGTVQSGVEAATSR